MLKQAFFLNFCLLRGLAGGVPKSRGLAVLGFGVRGPIGEFLCLLHDPRYLYLGNCGARGGHAVFEVSTVRLYTRDIYWDKRCPTLSFRDPTKAVVASICTVIQLLGRCSQHCIVECTGSRNTGGFSKCVPSRDLRICRDH